MSEMGGWTRLWLAISAILFVCTFAVSEQVGSVYESTPENLHPTREALQAYVNQQAKLNDCAKGTSTGTVSEYDGSYEFKCTRKNALSLRILYSLIGPAILYGLGWTIGWIYRGFKRKPN